MKNKTKKMVEQVAKFISGTLIVGLAFICFDLTRLPFWRVALGIMLFLMGTIIQMKVFDEMDGGK